MILIRKDSINLSKEAEFWKSIRTKGTMQLMVRKMSLGQEFFPTINSWKTRQMWVKSFKTLSHYEDNTILPERRKRNVVISLIAVAFSLECLSRSWFQEGYHETEHSLFLSVLQGQTFWNLPSTSAPTSSSLSQKWHWGRDPKTLQTFRFHSKANSAKLS